MMRLTYPSTKLLKVITIPVLFFTIGSLYLHDASAQTNNRNSNSPDWLLILLSGLTAAGASAGISAFVTLRQVKHDHENAMKQIQKNYEYTMEQLIEQRAVDSMKERVHVYSFFLFNLNRMLNNPWFATGREAPKDIANTVDEIDAELKGKYYLLNTEAGLKWMAVRHELKHNVPIPIDNVRQVVRIRNILTKEYNGSINANYEKLLKEILPKIYPQEVILYVDPYCNNGVVNMAQDFTEVGGNKVYFCSLSCKLAFEGDSTRKSEFEKNPALFGY
jgi:YHS domain-containing protein